jgi:toxin ParE1/3/4
VAKFRLTQKAKADLISIGRYTQQAWGAAQRNLYLIELDGRFHELAANPLIGKECSEIRAGYRKFLQGRHVIFYQSVSKQEILIVRINLHQSMDIASKF